jgi:hypothetical protein
MRVPHLYGLIGVLALTAGCASAPSPSPTAVLGKPPAVVQTGPALPRATLICQEKAAAARFADLGVTKGEEPIAVALSKDATYVLFRPARLLRVTHKDGKIQAETALGKEGESWTALDVDPLDGSAWVATDHLTLLRISPEWKSKVVKIQSKVEGTGSFRRLRIMPDAIYAAPSCAEAAVWRLDRDGKVLGTAFSNSQVPLPADSEPLQLGEMRCSFVRLERGANGEVLAWDAQKKTLQQADAQGVWTAADPANAGFFKAVEDAQPNMTVAKGMAIGKRDEAWYVNIGFVGDLFWWKGKPVLLGPVTARSAGGRDTLLLVPNGDGMKEVLENCYGAHILAVTNTPTQYAAVTWDAIILGDFATAPDLP